MKSIKDKLSIQAQEAKFQGMTKLAAALENMIEDQELVERGKIYTQTQLDEDIYHDLWRVATRLLVYYGVNTSAEKLDKSIITLASFVTEDLEKTLEVTNVIKGPLEPKLLGEK
jgi:hypothetical protein